MTARPACNICGGRAFGDTFGRAGSAFIRKNVRCEGCGSLERHRLIFGWLRAQNLLSGNRRVLHIAPEECLATVLRNRFGNNYICGDTNPAQFSFPGVMQIDLCRDLPRFTPGSFDLILHNHVLEHVICDYQTVAKALHRLLKPGGLHVFTIPFLDGGFREALGEQTDDDRTAIFGQWDHMRVFSPDDLQQTLGEALPLPPTYDATLLLPSEKLLAINVPESSWHGFNNNAVFVLQKEDENSAIGDHPPTESGPDRQIKQLKNRPPAVLFVSANGIGQGHLSRQLAVARRLKQRPAAFLTMSYSAGIATDLGFPTHFLPHHHATGEDPAAWNALLAMEIELLLDEYSATTLVYDVNFVFDGVIEVLKKRRELQSVWLRRGMWPHHHAAYAGAGVHFQMIIEPGDFAAEADDGPTSTDRQRTIFVPPIILLDPSERLDRAVARDQLGLPSNARVILLDLSRASNPALTRLHEALLNELSTRRDIHVVELKSSLSGNVSPLRSVRHHRFSLYPAYAYSRAWDAAVVRASYNTFHENLIGSIPTLFVPDETPDMDRQIDRARWAALQGHALMHRLSGSDIELFAMIDRLLSAEGMKSLGKVDAEWQNGGDIVAALLEERVQHTQGNQ